MQWYCILLGFTAVVMDFKNLRIKTYITVNFYVMLINLMNIYFILKTTFENFWMLYTQDFNFITLYSAVYISLTRSLLVLMVNVMRCKRDEKLKKYLKEIFNLNSNYFIEHQHLKRDTTLWIFWYCNTIILTIHSICYPIFILKAIRVNSILNALEHFSTMSLIGMLHIIMLHHTLILCYIYEYFSIINQQLKYKISICHISQIYFQLCSLLKRFNRIYSPMIISLQITFVIAISSMLYTFILNIYSRCKWIYI